MARWYGQYNPASNGDTCIGAPLSVRFARDLEEGLNNAKRYAMRDKVLSHVSPAGTQSTQVQADDEYVALVFAPRIVPRGYDSIRFTMGHWLTDGGGSVIWRLYSMPRQYKGDSNFAAGVAMLPAGSTNASIITNSSTYSIAVNALSPIARGYNDETWLMLTGQPVSMSTAKFYTLDAWPARADDPTGDYSGGGSPVSSNRLYLNSTTPPVDPVVNDAWGTVEPNGMACTLTPARDGVALWTWGVGNLQDVTDEDVAIFRAVSPPLDGAQTISGTVKMQCGAVYSSSVPVSKCIDLVEMYVVSGDGSTVRGELLTKAAAKNTAYASGGVRNKTFADGDAVASVNAEDGDRIVVKFGARVSCTHGTIYVWVWVPGSGDLLGYWELQGIAYSDFWVQARVGDPIGTTEFPEDETTTTDLVPWVEFSTELDFQ